MLYTESRRDLFKRGLLIGAALAWPTVSHAQIATLNEAINKAGRQRMLSQRMAKAWLAVGQGVDVRRAEKILFDSMAWFDRQLVELKAYAPSADIAATYQALEPVWAQYKTALVGNKPDRDAAPALLQLDSKVLKLAHQGTQQLEAFSGKPVGRLVNLAGRQRMLSQRTAKFYLSQTWGTALPDQLQELQTARKEFAQALTTLTSAPQATEAIRQELELAKQQWIFFDNALGRVGERANSSQHAAEVFSSSEHILQIMDKVTGMYSRLT
jgi:nitrate/nitrite-specific signal transduction histidine kinase